jgi:YhcH/YjgK/YiaL family protein
MFFSNIAIAEKYDYLEEKFRAAYRWLAETDIKALPEGSYPILGDKVIANVQEYITEPKETRFFETHKLYFDIQYMVTGDEMFGVCKAEGLVLKEAIEANDLYFYEEPAMSGEVLLKEGDLIVVAPEDAHKPRCAAGAPAAVKKVVVKVAL